MAIFDHYYLILSDFTAFHPMDFGGWPDYYFWLPHIFQVFCKPATHPSVSSLSYRGKEPPFVFSPGGGKTTLPFRSGVRGQEFLPPAGEGCHEVTERGLGRGGGNGGRHIVQTDWDIVIEPLFHSLF